MNDIEAGIPLESVDPAYADPGYWERFQERVMRAAAPALALRRQAAELTMGDLLLSWSRLVVPGAVMAAAVAGLLLIRAPAIEEFSAPLLGLEELGIPDWGSGPDALPAFLVSEEPVDRDAVMVAVEGHWTSERP